MVGSQQVQNTSFSG
jgi:hypothetical protein